MNQKEKEDQILQAAAVILGQRGEPALGEGIKKTLEDDGPPVIRKFTALGGAGIVHKDGHGLPEWRITKVMLYSGDMLLGSALISDQIILRPNQPVNIGIEGRS